MTLGFASGDRFTTMIAQADYMLTLAGVFLGTATQASEFNFETALVPLTGPN